MRFTSFTGPQKKPYKTRGKRQSCQIDPCLPPYRVTLHDQGNPSRSSTLGDELILMEETRFWQKSLTTKQLLHGAKGKNANTHPQSAFGWVLIGWAPALRRSLNSPGILTWISRECEMLGVTIPGHFLAVLGPKYRKFTVFYRKFTVFYRNVA